MLESFWGTLCPKKASYWIQKKVFAIMNMPPPKTPKDIEVLNGMAQFYQ
jgi:hypothetical protein